MSRKFALIVGNSDYSDKNLAGLKTPVADVQALAEVLSDPTRGGFDNAPTLINESESKVRREIERFFAKKQSDDLLVLYFSGHGVLDEHGRLYLAVRDTEHELWTASAIPATFITDNMDRSQSRRQVLILDCCHSGAFFRGTKAVTGAKAVTKATFEGNGYGKVVLTATDTTQYAWEGDQAIGETENSVFTHFLIEGLKTGKADANQDGQITLDELYDYVYKSVITATSKQTPRRWVYNQQGDLVIARNPFPIIKPIPLPDELLRAIEDTNSYVREGAVRGLERLLKAPNKGLALAAREALERIAADEDTTQRVAKLASEILEENAEAATPLPAPAVQPKTVESEKLGAASEEAEKEIKQPEKEEGKERKKREDRSALAKLEGDAEAAIAKKDWSEAIAKLDALLVLNPGHAQAAARLKDVSEEVEEAKRQQRIADLEREAQAAEDKEDWNAVSEKRQALLALEPDHAESIFKLSYAQKQQKLADLYAEGQKSYATHDWSQALGFFEQAQHLKDDYKDVIKLIAGIQQRIAEKAKSLPPKRKDPPSPSEVTTPALPPSRDPQVQPEMFTGLTLSEHKRKLWPLAMCAGIVFMVVSGIVAYIGWSNQKQFGPTSSVNMPATTSSPEASLSVGMDIRKVDFKNFTFVVDGRTIKSTSSDNKIFSKIAYGDLTSDGIEEAAMIVFGGNNAATYACVYKLQNGKPVALQYVKCLADLSKMASVSIQSQQLKVGCYSEIKPQSSEFIEITTYEWKRDKFERTGSINKPNPEYQP